jgi:hypothetical protein
MSPSHAFPQGFLRRDQAHSVALWPRSYGRRRGAHATPPMRPVGRCRAPSIALPRAAAAAVPDACDPCPSLGQRGDTLVTVSSMSSACVRSCSGVPRWGPCAKLRHRAEGQSARQQVSVSEPRYRTLATSLQGGPCANSDLAVVVGHLRGARPGFAGRGGRREAAGSRADGDEHARSGARGGRPILEGIGTVALRCDQIGASS